MNFYFSVRDIDLGKNLTTQQARVEDITLKEDFGTFVATQDDDFGDMGVGGCGSFGMDMMDTFMISSDLERGRQLENGSSLVHGNENEDDPNSGLDFFDDRSAVNKSNFDSKLE